MQFFSLRHNRGRAPCTNFINIYPSNGFQKQCIYNFNEYALVLRPVESDHLSLPNLAVASYHWSLEKRKWRISHLPYKTTAGRCQRLDTLFNCSVAKYHNIDIARTHTDGM
ncbi:hypothetical protein Egran_00993 [Elaphomyces granulatus]|uniref:Uncharacterized protein n=1 Tax=Elaphomyces granulatus TaxID=519963 RepID=A0A232M4A3_9EURO|nr:hypothetical protein Egran_00993 [Elaphomyces granulatus]